MNDFYPIFLRLTGKKAVVIGGGPVAARKTASLAEAGARVTVISPELSTAFDGLVKDGAFIHEARKYRPGDLSGAFIAVAATDDPRTNIDAATEADSLGIPVNSANPPGAGSFIVPSSIHRGGLTIAISTGGAAPALSRKLRLDIESFLTDQYGWFLEFLEEARAALKESVPAEEARRQVLEGLVGSGLVESFKGDREAALKKAWEKYELLVAMHGPSG
jgi:precorrin-2 dehydrogenase/sirohydrochlorin ferrochelatase